jgi:hypothetical protein
LQIVLTRPAITTKPTVEEQRIILLFQSPITKSLFLLTGLLEPACGVSMQNTASIDGKRATAQSRENDVTDAAIPISKRFATLDDYLLHLEQVDGPIDRPWYKEVRPGVYELQTGNLRRIGVDNEKRTFTRDELKAKFGFTR